MKKFDLNTIKEQALDRQLLFMLTQGTTECITDETLLGMFKYSLLHEDKTGSVYQCIREAILERFGDAVLEDLEVTCIER